jgi:hypothetical protein
VSADFQTSNSGLIVLENLGSASVFAVACAQGTSCAGTYPQQLIASRPGFVWETVFQEGVTTPTCAGM